MGNVRLESLKKSDGRSELRRAGFIIGNKRENGANQGRLRGKWGQPRKIGEPTKGG